MLLLAEYFMMCIATARCRARSSRGTASIRPEGYSHSEAIDRGKLHPSPHNLFTSLPRFNLPGPRRGGRPRPPSRAASSAEPPSARADVGTGLRPVQAERNSAKGWHFLAGRYRGPRLASCARRDSRGRLSPRGLWRFRHAGGSPANTQPQLPTLLLRGLFSVPVFPSSAIPQVCC